MNKKYYELDDATKVKYFSLSFMNGFRKTVKDKNRLTLVAGYIVFCMIFWKGLLPLYAWIFPEETEAFSYHLLLVSFPIVLIGGVVGLVMLSGRPFGAQKINENLWEIGLVNHSGGSPLLVDEYTDSDNDKVTIYDFFANNVPRIRWETEKEKVEIALDCNVLHIREGKNKQTILVYTVENNFLPEIIYWEDSFISSEDFKLVIGESYQGQEMIDLNITPHVLIGGATGSGKSFLAKLLLVQAVIKRADVYIADFKGGIDFGEWWRDHTRFCTNKQEVISNLTELVKEMEKRKQLFLETESKNISEYNKISDKSLNRIIFAFDEFAEVLDKKGLSKDEKEVVYQIESLLSTIARLGRAYGIHLVLVTQRPDANILSGQIKNNLTVRICGRADNVLSQIILDNTTASKEIENYAQGRFINQDETVFQSYLLDEGNLSYLE